MTRGREKLIINKAEFQAVVDNLESTREFPNISALWVAVEETEWASNLKPRPLTAAVANSRAKDLEITYKTKAGKRGGEMTAERIAKMREGRGKRVPRREKLAEEIASVVAHLRKSVPQQYQYLVDTYEKGSIKAAFALKCLDCCAFQRTEVKFCACDGCALIPYRPSKPKKGEVAPIEEDEEEITKEAA